MHKWLQAQSDVTNVMAKEKGGRGKKIWKKGFYHRTDLDTHFRGQQSHIMINSRRKGIAPNIAKVTEIP